MARIHVAFDVPTIAKAVSQLGPGAVLFPAAPPETGATYADALGVFTLPDDYFALILSAEILEAMLTALMSELKWSFDEASDVADLLVEMAQEPGGGLMRPDYRVTLVGSVVDKTVRAARAIAAPGLSPQRLLVTEDPQALRLGELVARGVPFHPNHHIAVESPQRFVTLAANTRQRMREIE